ncbi:MAG: hypothetical protein ACE14W_09130 [Candidatus Velamenicoccus archaeovorus]
MSENENGKRRIDLDSELGMSRRDLLRRGAIVGGTLLWVAPAVQSITPIARAQTENGSPTCSACYCFTGTLPTPSKEFGVVDFFTAPGQASPEDCDAWCKQSSPYNATTGAPGGPYADSQYCKGQNCQANVGTGPGGPHGATCS